ncbi:MAG TPA: fused MFS/spermidine synthase [Solirubrobacteraceae bacterium]|nr:fused MFS/spermidine synthase [Solirubrobacteraceae bacterium]
MDRPRFAPSLGVVVFVVGTGSLGAEIAAARLLAPYFGDSTLIWANTIGIVLVALSAGYWYGGKRADRDPSLTGLYKLVLLAAILTAAIPFVADPFLDVAVDALDSISAGAFVGSLLGVSVLVAVPVFVMGMVSPYALRLGVHAVGETGQTAGRLYALSTIGSLTGNFASALVLIPLVGTRRTFLVFALAFAIVAALGLRRRPASLVPVGLVALFLVPAGAVKAAERDGERVIHETDTQYQYARVIEQEDGDRILELNEGQAVHSLKRAGSYLTGNYWDEMLVGPFVTRGEAPRRIAILGNAAGTTARAYGHFFPQTYVDGVEIDGELTEIGREYFDLQGPRLETFTEDARPYLRQTDRRYDAIVVDAYHQPYVPFYMATKEFFELARDRLNPGGVVLVNVGHPESSDRLEQVLSATMDAAFDTVLRDPVEDTNTILIGTNARGAGAERVRAAAPSLPAALQPIALELADRIEPRLRGGSVYTDDKSPVEWLVDASIVEVAAKGER